MFIIKYMFVSHLLKLPGKCFFQMEVKPNL